MSIVGVVYEILNYFSLKASLCLFMLAIVCSLATFKQESDSKKMEGRFMEMEELVKILTSDAEALR